MFYRLKQLFIIWDWLSALITSKICRESQRRSKTVPPNGRVDHIISLIIWSIVYTLYRYVFIILSNTNGDVLYSSSASTEFTLVEHVFWWWTGLETLRAECAVFPPSHSWETTAEYTAFSFLSPFLLMYHCMAEVMNVSPVPPGDSTKNENSIF